MSKSTKHLVLVHGPGFQERDDLEAIAKEAEKIDQSVTVHIAHSKLDNSRLNRKLVGAPTLVVSFAATRYEPSRGRLLKGRKIPKLEQIRLLEEHKVPCPRTKLLNANEALDLSDWGNPVLLKPNAPTSTHGVNIVLARHERVQAVASSLANFRDHGILVQEYIHTGAQPTSVRVLTLFGEPLFCRSVRRTHVRVDLEDSDENLERVHISTTGPGARQRELVTDRDILDLARRVHSVAPDVPLKGIDLVRRERDGRLFVLEFNPGGNTWHFSSKGGETIRANLGHDLGYPEVEAEPAGRAAMIAQFAVFRTAARVLVEQCHLQAE